MVTLQNAPTVDAYIAAQPMQVQRFLKRVRTLIQKALPGVVDGISYQIPVFKMGGQMVCFFAGHAEHYAIYPITPFVIEALHGEIERYLHGKATVRFAYDDTMPTHLIQRIVKLRATEVAAALPPTKKTKKVTAKKKAPAKASAKKKAPAKKTSAKRTSPS